MPFNPQIDSWQPPPIPQNKQPRGRGRRSEWEPFAAELRRSPGRWLKVAVNPNHKPGSYTRLVHRITTEGSPECFSPAGSFEAMWERDITGSVYVYLRYKAGEKSE